MRLLKLAIVIAVVILAPARADAWFGFLDYLSGPGPFYGQLYDVRLLCFGKEFTVADDAETKLKAAFRASLAGNPAGANTAWADFRKAVNDANGLFPVLPPALRMRLDDALRKFEAANRPRSTLQEEADFEAAFLEAIQQGEEAIGTFYHANNVQLSPGVLISLCQERATRKFALDLAVDAWQAKSHTSFANDHTIRLITVMPGVSIRPIANPKYDYFDLGLAVGKYWFSSRGFDEFSGLVVQPLRIDVHGPSSLANAPGLKQFAGLFTFRFGFTVFPGGFDADAFEATGDRATPIGAEWTKTAAIFFNLTPFLHHHNVF
jgi:hypothetical protein